MGKLSRQTEKQWSVAIWCKSLKPQTKEDQPNKTRFFLLSFCVLACMLEVISIDANTRTQSRINSNHPLDLGLFAILKKQSGNLENRIAQPGRGFVCCTRIAQRSIKTVNLLYAALFAIRKTGISSLNQPYLSRPLCAACQHGQQTDIPIPGEKRTFAAYRNSVTQPDASHGSENGNAGGLYKASIYPYRSSPYNPPALAQSHHNRRIPFVWPHFKAPSRLSYFALLPLPLYLRLNASRIA